MMSRHLVLCSFLALPGALLSGCSGLMDALELIRADLEPLDISTSIAYQNPLPGNGRLAMDFPETDFGGNWDPSLYDYSSSGDTSGATIAVVTVESSKTFYVTGARIENPEIELTEIGGSDPTGNGWIAYSYYNPAAPASGHDVLEPLEVAFPADDDEVIHIRASLFLEGYLADGTEFSGAFPPPLVLDMEIRHDPGY